MVDSGGVEPTRAGQTGLRLREYLGAARIEQQRTRHFILRGAERLAGSMHRELIAAVHLRPVDVLHEGFDVCPGGGAKVEVIGVLVHVERKQRDPAGQRMRMVRRPLVDERAVARLEREHDPA